MVRFFFFFPDSCLFSFWLLFVYLVFGLGFLGGLFFSFKSWFWSCSLLCFSRSFVFWFLFFSFKNYAHFFVLIFGWFHLPFPQTSMCVCVCEVKGRIFAQVKHIIFREGRISFLSSCSSLTLTECIIQHDYQWFRTHTHTPRSLSLCCIYTLSLVPSHEFLSFPASFLFNTTVFDLLLLRDCG